MAASDFERQISPDQIDITADGRGASAEWVTLPVFQTQNAVENDAGFPVSINDPHPDYPGSDLKANRITVARRGRSRSWTIRVGYAIPESGGSHSNPDNPLAQPTVASWSSAQYTFDVDRDRDGNPIQVQPGRVPQNVPQKTVNAQRLTLTRNFASWTPTTTASYENHVNSAVYEGAAVDTVRCNSIIPSEAYEAGFSYIRVSATFEFRSVEVWGILPHEQPFWRMDTVAKATIPGQGDHLVSILGGDGLPVSAPVMLDKDGVPVSPSGTTLTYYNPLTREVVESGDIAWVSQGLPGGAINHSGGAAGEPVQLVYRVLPGANFNDLNF